MKTRARRRRLRLPDGFVTRDRLLFVVGLAGIVYETVSGGAEKPTLIIAFVGMLGLPLFIKTDEQHQDGDPPPDDDRPPQLSSPPEQDRPRPRPNGVRKKDRR